MAKKRKPIGFLESAVRKMQKVATMAPICGGTRDTHESEYVETIVTGRGWPHDVFKCRHCGERMSRPVRPQNEPERFLLLASQAVIDLCLAQHAAELEAAIDAYNAKLEELQAPITDALEKYNEAVTDADAFRDDVACEMEGHYEDK